MIKRSFVSQETQVAFTFMYDRTLSGTTCLHVLLRSPARSLMRTDSSKRTRPCYLTIHGLHSLHSGALRHGRDRSPTAISLWSRIRSSRPVPRRQLCRKLSSSWTIDQVHRLNFLRSYIISRFLISRVVDQLDAKHKSYVVKKQP